MRKFLVLILLGLFLSSCGKNYTPEQKVYIDKILKERKDKDHEMETADWSPFVNDEKADFHPLKYFDVDPEFVFKSKLVRYTKLDTVTIYGTKGEPRKTVKFGYLSFTKNNKKFDVTVYQSPARDDNYYYSIWFTDQTTNKESYGVGRYIDFDLNDNQEYVYTLDFNKAYNPYCSYSAKYSCAIPSKDDYIDLAINAGEKKFHD